MFGTLNKVKDTSAYFRVRHEFLVNWLIGLHLVHKIINTGDNLRINYSKTPSTSEVGMLNRVIGIRISIVSEWYLSSQLRSTRLPHTDLAVSRLFTSPGNSIGDMLVCAIRSNFRSATERRSFEARMIFGHRTLKPAGLNVDFNLI